MAGLEVSGAAVPLECRCAQMQTLRQMLSGAMFDTGSEFSW